MTFSYPQPGYLWCAVASFFSAAATYMLKNSSGYVGYADVAKLAWMGGASLSYIVGFFCYGQALSRLEMTIAYPVMTSFTLAAVAIAGRVLLGETLTWSKLSGMFTLCMACWLMAR